jgi:osmotically-inducible protein OsmY
VDAEVRGAVVTLTGWVMSASARDEIAQRIQGVARVREVRNRIAVLPGSAADDDLRRKLARGIYGNASFWNYAATEHPTIRIIVEHGHVTLAGSVRTEADRALARALATQFDARSVTSLLRTDAERRDTRGPFH